MPDFGHQRRRAALAGEPPSPLEIPSGCRFHRRCPLADPAVCAVEEPRLEGPVGHLAACHFPLDRTPADAGAGRQ